MLSHVQHVMWAGLWSFGLWESLLLWPLDSRKATISGKWHRQEQLCFSFLVLCWLSLAISFTIRSSSSLASLTLKRKVMILLIKLACWLRIMQFQTNDFFLLYYQLDKRFWPDSIIEYGELLKAQELYRFVTVLIFSAFLAFIKL